VRCFGVEGGDFFILIEKLDRAVQQHMHIDSFIDLGMEGRLFRDLKDRTLESNRIVFGHRAPILETQGRVDLKGADFFPGRLSVERRLRESAVMPAEVALKYGLCLLFGFGSGQSELAEQSVLKRFP
jgi:hypothetical protein